MANDERLYINGHQITLKPGQAIARTLQVNDLASLSNRNANFTRTIDIPKTPENIIAMDYLGVVGSNSSVPYQKNTAQYFVGNECLIYNGWANISETSDSYKTNIVDGIVDFYKAITNESLTDVGISDLNHLKNSETIISSWSADTPYRYILADYNGKSTIIPTGSTFTAINTDFLIPSCKVKYLWDRIFDNYGFEYSGEVFTTEAFENLWMTYPKSTSGATEQLEFIHSQTFELQLPNGSDVNYDANLLQDCFTSPLANSVHDGDGHCRGILPNNPGLYRLDFTGYLRILTLPDGTQNWGGIEVVKHNTVTNIFTTEIVQTGIGFNTWIETGKTFAVGVNEVIYAKIIPDRNTPFVYGNLNIKFSKVLGENISFENALIDFKVSDFISEILQRFSLTMFPDKYQNKISFLTTSEWLQTESVLNWSDKFQSLNSTSYALSGYAQKNRFKYKYNDEGANYNDGFISVDNANLSDDKVVIQSGIYSPEKQLEVMKDFQTHVFKFWDREIKDGGAIQYKPLENRYYFLRSEAHTFGVPAKFGSETANVFIDIDTCQKGSFERLDYQSIIEDYYNPIGSILNTSKLMNVEFNLSTIDINNFDFRNLIFVEQLGSYFMVNKILNFVPNKVTRCEIIEVDYQKQLFENPSTPPYIIITDLVADGCEVTITFDTNVPNLTSCYLVGTDNAPVFPAVISQNFVGIIGNTITVTVPRSAGWSFKLYFSASEPSTNGGWEFVQVTTCGLPSTDLTYININSLQTLSVINNVRKVRINFTTDLPLPNSITIEATNFFSSLIVRQARTNVNLNYLDIDLEHVHHILLGNSNWDIILSHGTISSNFMTSSN